MIWRRRSLPADLALERGERVLAVADGTVVATNLALHLPGGVRLPWYEIDHAQWKDEALHVRSTSGAEHHASLAEPARLPEVVRERVTASIVVNRHVSVHGAGVRLVGRRIPGVDEVHWSMIFDDGVDPAEPGLRAMAEQALEEVRRSLGA